jgi:hypothetical protein
MIQRRQILASSLVSMLPSQPLAPKGRGSISDLDPLELFARMRCAPDGRPVWWWLSGHILGRLEGNALRHAFTVQVVNRSKITQRSDGSWVYEMVEAGYYGAPDQNGIIDGEMANPLTGEKILPEHFFERLKLRFTPDLAVTFEGSQLPQGSAFEGRLIAPDIKGQRIWMTEELLAKIPAPVGKPPIILNSLATFEAGLADLDASFTPASMQYTTVNSFRPWMKMGTKRGDLAMRLNGVKLASWLEVPSRLRRRIEADHGDAFEIDAEVDTP